MRNLIIILVLLFNAIGYSQTEFKKFESKYDEFDFYAKPSTTNSLSRYFKNHINVSLLNAVKFRETIESQKRIFLVFRLDSKNDIKNMYVSSAYSELNNSIMDAFKKYDISKLNIQDKNRKNIYVLQIISSENGKAILNCSSEIIYDRLPLFDGCETGNSNGDVKKCINKYIENHIVKNISFEKVQNAKIIGELKLNVKFTVDADGTIKNIDCKAPTETLTEELNRLIAMLPKPNLYPTRNGNPTFLEIKETVFLNIEPKTARYKEEVQKSKDTLLDENSDLALHFKKYITDAELQNIKLHARQNSIDIFFSIDKKGRYVDVKNTLKNELLSEKLNTILKKYPIEKHGIKDANPPANYSYSIITKGFDSFIIQTQHEPIVMVLPIFKGCEKASFSESRKCTNDMLGYLLKNEFDKNLCHKTDLKGIIRIQCTFKIDTEGNIVDVKVRAPNPYLANEVERIIKNMPPAIKPGMQHGKPVTVPYSLPVAISVGENNPENAFKSYVKKP